MTPEGRLTLITRTPQGAQMLAVDADTFGPFFVGWVPYKRIDPYTGDESQPRPPQMLIRDLVNTRSQDWPILRQLIHTPIVDASGKQITKRGYIPELEVYLDTDDDWLELPDVITEDDIATAIDIVLEPIRDFAFADFGDDTSKAIYSNEKDDDGHFLPNLERGEASRCHALAYMGNPLWRHLVDDPCPAFAVLKPAAGSGAGYLADVGSIIALGYRAPVAVMSKSDEEFRKNITANLIDGAAILFIDNINRLIESGDLAAALTAGTWRDRILGHSKVTNIPIRNTWLLAGNGLEFSDEIAQRIVPIQIDTKKKKPRLDRPQSTFKHRPLHDYVKANRRNLVWAFNLLLKNWIDKGSVPGEQIMGSYDKWSRMVSGIFRDAGIPGFLGNIRPFLDKAAVSQSTPWEGILAAMQAQNTTNGWETFTAPQALGMTLATFDAGAMEESLTEVGIKRDWQGEFSTASWAKKLSQPPACDVPFKATDGRQMKLVWKNDPATNAKAYRFVEVTSD